VRPLKVTRNKPIVPRISLILHHFELVAFVLTNPT
jgi:hypothetical protein